MKRIHWNEVWRLMEQPKAFSLVYIKKSTGEYRNVPSCTCTSIHAKGSTLNILLPGEEKPKTIRKCLIIEFNGMSVYL